MKISKLNRITHRDIGYLITGLTIIYALSGIALNHKHNWNPNYIIDHRIIKTDMRFDRETIDDDKVLEFLDEIGESTNFKTYYYPTGDKLTVFLEGGSLQVNVKTGEGYVERLTKRPLFYQINFLHYNPGRWWKYFSDIYCLSLILVTITGLFIVKGRNGITKRGAILTAAGIILPLIFLFIY